MKMASHHDAEPDPAQQTHLRHRAPSPSPSPASTSSSRQGVDFSPPLIAMVVVVAAAFIFVTYSRLISRRLIHPMIHLFRRRRSQPPSINIDILDSPTHLLELDYSLSLSPYGLDDAAIKTLPLSLYNYRESPKDCAVCLLEFGDEEYVRTLPVCSHAFHVDCIDVWLKSHANCPLCRAAIFVPLMAARIRPTLDLDDAVFIQPSPPRDPTQSLSEITEEASPPRRNFNSADHQRFHFVLKRSYSFGFERSIAAERLVTEANTASPWRFRRGGGLWSKRMSPLMAKPRVLSFRSYYRGMKASPFWKRRLESRRSKSMASPMLVGSSRMRCGDPEALLSPERLNRR